MIFYKGTHSQEQIITENFAMANLLAHLFVIGIGVTIVTAEDAFVRNVTELVKLNTNIEISLTDIKDPYWIQADGPGVVNGFRTCGECI